MMNHQLLARSPARARFSKGEPVRRSQGLPLSLVQRSSCACGGSCPRCQAGASSSLRVSEPDDALEREADQVADKVMRSPSSPIEQSESEVRPAVRRKPIGDTDAAVAGTPVASGLQSPGKPLDTSTRDFMESRFGHDFAEVRVHDGAEAAQSAEGINARAYTVGADIVFGAHEYTPQSQSGRQLLAHELTHVVQQQAAPEPMVNRLVRRANVSCEADGLTNPALTGDEVVQAITDADAEAITLAQAAEDQLTTNLDSARAGDPVDAAFDTILQEELGLTLTNRAHFPIIQQQITRFNRVRTTLESGYLRYQCLGGENFPLVGCTAGACGTNFAFSCPGNRLIVLCPTFWNTPDQRGLTLLHEPFHVWFSMLQHAPNALRRADSSCFESFAARVSGQAAPASCVGHTAG